MPCSIIIVNKLIALMEDAETPSQMKKPVQMRFYNNFELNVVANQLLSFLCADT
jgi:hypothetical protein